MSQLMEAQKGQEEVGAPRPTRGTETLDRQTAVQESIKYRRRAQEAERRAEALEAEVQELREGRAERIVALESDLAAARAEADAVRGRLETIERDRRLECEFLKAGCMDLETAMAVAHERLAAQAAPGEAGGSPQPLEDPAAFALAMLEQKPHLRGGAAGVAPGSPTTEGLPPRTAAARPASASAPRRALERLADQAKGGSSKDLMAYMRARRRQP